MFTPELDLRCVQIFLAVAEHKSVKQASNILGISSPAISQALKQLEEQMDTQLFYRDFRPLRLTASGRKLRTEGSVLVESAKLLKTRIRSADFKFESLRLGIGESATATFSPFLLAMLRGRVADLTMESLLTAPLVEKLQNEQIDVLISPDPLLDNDRWMRREIFREDYLLVFKADNPRELDPSFLKQLSETKPYISYGKGSFDRVVCDRYLRSLNIKPIEVITASSSYTITGLVDELDGWALLTPMNALGGKTFLDHLNWSVLPKNHRLSRGTWVVGDKNSRATQVKLVADLSVECMENKFSRLIENFAPTLAQFIHIVK